MTAFVLIRRGTPLPSDSSRHAEKRPARVQPGKPATPVVCWFLETIHNHQFVPANGGQRTCAPYDPSLVS
jgi:hypothetical protein